MPTSRRAPGVEHLAEDNKEREPRSPCGQARGGWRVEVPFPPRVRVDIACRLARLPRPCRAGRAARAKFVIPLQAHGGKGPPSAVARGLESGCPLRLQGEPLGARRGEEGGGEEGGEEEEEEEEDPIQEA
ncbi:unnamed protein product [Prorocentrum cordatum]|uniref:Uncharacterized protein n=1 Tax=Prorocentrum cordatum TaxID=2364126 RepID=A0ABN9S9D6_9DINO|nr:unnamed protein product [Polarella glacialis]